MSAGTISERCGCGAELTVDVDLFRKRRTLGEDDALHQPRLRVVAWRELHDQCAKASQRARPVSPKGQA